MTKVCHMTSVHGRYDSRIFQKECQSLCNAGFDVSLVVCDDMPDEHIDGIHIISTQFQPQNRLQRFRDGTKLVYKKAMEVDAEIYHLHDPELLPYANKLKKARKKVIFDSHEIYYYQIKEKKYLPKWIMLLIAEAYKIYEKNILSKIDAVIVPCTFGGKNYFEGIAKKTVFINNLPEKERFTITNYKEKGTTPKCCHIGSLSTARGINEMLVAAKETGVKLILAGDEKSLSKDERRFLKEEQISGAIDFRGYVDKDEAAEIYHEAFMGLSLLHNEGQYITADNLPTKIYEYMLAGIPVIASKQASTEKFFSEYPVGILVDVENQQEINNAILYLKENLSEAEKMGEVGRKITTEKLCWENEAKKLVRLYNEFLKEKL